MSGPLSGDFFLTHTVYAYIASLINFACVCSVLQIVMARYGKRPLTIEEVRCRKNLPLGLIRLIGLELLLRYG